MHTHTNIPIYPRIYTHSFMKSYTHAGAYTHTCIHTRTMVTCTHTQTNDIISILVYTHTHICLHAGRAPRKAYMYMHT